jgi:glycerophosphoryl diester phosphodiesterase
VRPAALHPHFSVVDAAYVRQAREKGYRVNVWTVNEVADLERMIALDVDGIITDHPALLGEMLGRGETG